MARDNFTNLRNKKMKKLSLISVMLVISANSAFAQVECATVAECAQKAVEAAYQAKIALQLAVPKGAVMAFNLKECPDGWEAFVPVEGRVIVGSGEPMNLTKRVAGQTGGAETHQLSVAEMPSHTHTLKLGNNTGRGPDRMIQHADPHGGSHWPEVPSYSAGGGMAHNNMPPFIVLNYCERK